MVAQDWKLSRFASTGMALLMGSSACAAESEGTGLRPSRDENNAARDTFVIDVGAGGAMDGGVMSVDAGACVPQIDASCAVAPGCEVDCTMFLDIESRLSLLSNDIARVPTEDERRDVRYLDLSSYANAGHAARMIDAFRDALAFLLNSLSNNPTVRPLLPIDPERLVFRIRLSDYGWNASTWERIASFYPYDVRYDPTSRSFPITEAYAERLREATGTGTPFIQADWFFAHAARPPLYYDILDLPSTVQALEQRLSVNVQANVTALTAQRAGLLSSGESRFNRVLERHALSERGALWLTHDFASNAGTANVLTHPLDFQAQSRQIAFHLPNGLFAFMMVDGLGARLDRAPSSALPDPGARDLTMEAGLSCIGCHADDGALAARDEVRKGASLVTADPAVLTQVQALYPEQPVLDTLFAADRERHRRARVACLAVGFTGADMHALDAEHDRLLSLRDVAGILGIKANALIAALDATPRIFPNDILALRRIDARLPRSNFDAIFPDLVVGLSLGQAARRP